MKTRDAPANSGASHIVRNSRRDPAFGCSRGSAKPIPARSAACCEESVRRQIDCHGDHETTNGRGGPYRARSQHRGRGGRRDRDAPPAPPDQKKKKSKW